MIRRKLLALSGLLLCGGCVSGSEDSEDFTFFVTNERDSRLDVSIRLQDGERGFAVEGFVLESGETGRFTAGFVNVPREITVVTKILNPREATYRQSEIPVGVPSYHINIQSNGINVVWAEN